MSILAAAEWQYPILLGIGILVVGFAMLRMSRQRQLSRNSTSGGGRSAIRSAENLRDQLDALMVQLEELARSTSAQIETRYAKLEVLLDDADRKISRLESLLAGEPGGQASGGAPPPDAARPEHRRIHELADAGRTPVQIAQETGRDVGEIELILALRKK